MNAQKEIIYWNRLTDWQRSNEMGDEFGLKPKVRCGEEGCSCTRDEARYSFDPTSVDACLALAREKNLCHSIDCNSMGEYHAGVWNGPHDSFEPNKLTEFGNGVMTAAENLCICLLRHAGRTVDLSVEGETK